MSRQTVGVSPLSGSGAMGDEELHLRDQGRRRNWGNAFSALRLQLIDERLIAGGRAGTVATRESDRCRVQLCQQRIRNTGVLYHPVGQVLVDVRFDARRSGPESYRHREGPA